MTLLREFWRNTSGATAIEYGLIVALVGVVVSTAIGFVGDEVHGSFKKLIKELYGKSK